MALHAMRVLRCTRRPRLLAAMLLGVAAGGLLYVLDVERPAHVLPAWHAIWSLHFSPDARRLVTVHLHTDSETPRAERGVARLWDASNAERIAVLEESQELLSHVVFSPDGKLVAGSNESGDIRLWDADTGKRIGTYRMKGWDEWRSAAAIAFTPDGRLLMQAAVLPRLWDVQTDKEALDFTAALGGMHLRSYGSTRFVVAVGDVSARVIELGTGKPIAEFPLPEPKSIVLQHVHSADGKVLLANVAGPEAENGRLGVLRGPAYIWDRPGASPRLLPQLDHVEEYALSADGRHVAAHFRDTPTGWIDWLLRRGQDPVHTIVLFELESGRRVGAIRHGLHAVFGPDGRTLAVGCVGGTTELWEFPLQKAWGIISAGAIAVAGVAWLILRPWRRTAAAVSAVPLALPK